MSSTLAVSELSAALPTDAAAASSNHPAAPAAASADSTTVAANQSQAQPASHADPSHSHPYPPGAAAAPATAPAPASLLQNAAPSLVDPSSNDDLPALDDPELDALRDEIYSHIRHIRDPEHPHTIEALGVVYKSGLRVHKDPESNSGHVAHESVHVEFKPTVPHCSLATLIGLCIRTKVTQEIPGIKFSIAIKEGTHQTAEQINKQLNDKERATAALENPALRETVEKLIKDLRAYE